MRNVRFCKPLLFRVSQTLLIDDPLLPCLLPWPCIRANRFFIHKRFVSYSHAVRPCDLHLRSCKETFGAASALQNKKLFEVQALSNFVSRKYVYLLEFYLLLKLHDKWARKHLRKYSKTQYTLFFIRNIFNPPRSPCFLRFCQYLGQNVS